MDNRRGSDLLSDLPLDIVEKILMLLPIRDAIRTSTLSSKWRYRWVRLPQLVFNEFHMGFPARDEVLNEDDRFKNFVTRTLFRHQGSIYKFALHSKDMKSCPTTDEWLLFLSRKDVKELCLRNFDPPGEGFCLPSFLYSCRNLIRLELLEGQFGPPPPVFKGFLCLRTLILSFVDVPSATIESLIANSPLLERFDCTRSGHSKLRISAPNLNYAAVYGDYKELSLCAPLLAELCVTLDDMDGSGYSVEELPQAHPVCNYTKFLGGLTNLDTLIAHGFFTKFLSIGIEHYRHSLAFHHLEVIRLHDVNFIDMNEILLVVRLIMDATNLSYIEIESFYDREDASKSPDSQFWDSECFKNYAFKNLETVKMTEFAGEHHEQQFIQFLLQSSPVLELLTIEPDQTTQQEQETMDCIAKWLCYCQMLTNAEIFFKNK